MREERILFENGKQKIFIKDVCTVLNFNLKELSEHISIPYDTMKKYNQEMLLLPLSLVSKLCKLSSIQFNDLPIVDILSTSWGQKIGGKKGMKSLLQHYGTEQVQLWRQEGRMKGLRKIQRQITKNIKDVAVDRKFAEFVGVHLGDGTLTRGFLRISGDARYEYHYFTNYLQLLVKDVFGLLSKVDITNNTIYLRVNSVNLCKLLHKRFDIPYGNKIKKKVAIPNEIMKNRILAIACLRGLMDSDGTVSKDGDCLGLRFESYSPILHEQVGYIMDNLGVKSFENNEEVGTRSFPKIVRYFQLVGSSNLKHIIRFHKMYTERRLLYVREIKSFINKYKNIKLPFILP